MTPTHLLADVDAKRTLCGHKAKDVPLVLVEHVEAHVRGHGLLVCGACQAQTAQH